MQAPFSPDTVFRQSNRISSGSTIRKDGSLHRKSGSHRWQSAVADRYSQPARRYSCFGRVVQLDRADGTNSPLFTATGARVSELIQIKAEHVKLGHLDLYSKGGKLRRIYIPKELQNEALFWLAEKQQESGFIFLNKYGERITTRGISGQLKKLAVRYNINPAVVYPHSFRHRFAKSFLERCNDIAFLADLMGHESIETTRIYLRKTSTEQREIVDTIINW